MLGPINFDRGFFSLGWKREKAGVVYDGWLEAEGTYESAPQPRVLFIIDASASADESWRCFLFFFYDERDAVFFIPVRRN